MKNTNIQKKLAKRQKLTAAVTGALLGVLGAAVCGLGIALAASGASLGVCIGGAAAALAGLAMLAGAVPISRTIAGKRVRA